MCRSDESVGPKTGIHYRYEYAAWFWQSQAARAASLVYVFSMGIDYGCACPGGTGHQKSHRAIGLRSNKENRFASIAQDTVACIINDLISRALPVVLNVPIDRSSLPGWKNAGRPKVSIKGWRAGMCDLSEVVWGGGETQSLPGDCRRRTTKSAGSAFGIIQSKSHLIQGKNYSDGITVLTWNQRCACQCVSLLVRALQN